MAGSVLFSLSSKILSTIASPAFNMAYKKGVSIWEARDELSRLQVTIETLQAVVVDAEEKQEGSVAVKNWIKRLKGVLYDAEDFFDEVIAEDLLKGKKKNKVRVFCSKLNPIVSRNTIAKKVKAIRERLVDISTDMAQFRFVQHQPILSNMRGRHTARCSIDPKSVIGRDEEKKAILDMLICESSEIAISNGPVVIAIDGIGGMGKTTLAHLIYNDEKVKKFFENRWFACISDTSDDKEVLGKIYQSMCERGNYRDLSVIQLEAKIWESITGKKYLLVLDDVWEDHHGNWVNRKSILSSGAKGSKIIVTSRRPSVGISMGAIRAHSLKGLSEDDSWVLFKSLAFVSGYENDPRRESLGRELLKRCRGVPLAIWCMGSLLHNKTIREWEDIERVGLPTLGGSYNDDTMSILKLSYDHLPSNLKQCFTYCCLFPKDYGYGKKELIYHWIAQGYTTSNEGESDFMHLLRMGLFQEVKEDDFGEIYSCKMHDIMHDLASYLGAEESIMLSGTSSNVSSCTRYVSLMVDDEVDIPTPLLNVKSIRSYMLSTLSPWHIQPSRPYPDQLCSNFKLLRTLSLARMRIEYIPPSIGELKLLRYLDLSFNGFEQLPDSITNLVNLLILNIQWCWKLKVWPRNFKKLINLWSLDFKRSDKLMLMPDGIGEMDHLQYLSDFMLGKRSELDVLNGLLKQLRGELSITFCGEMEVEDEWNWQLPADVSLQHLVISDYPGQRIRSWGSNKLEHLELKSCENVKHLPPLSCLPILKRLKLENFLELEFMEEEEVNTHDNATPNKLLFPCLEELQLFLLPKLKGWRKKVAAEATSTSSSSTASASLEFSHLSKLHISGCPNLELNSVPLCPQLRELLLHNVGENTSTMIERELSSTILCPSTYQSLQKISIRSCKWLSSIPGEALVSLRELVIQGCCRLKSLQLASPHLLEIEIAQCDELTSIELCERPSLQSLKIRNCEQLKSLHIDEQQGLPKAKTRRLELANVDGVLIEQSLSAFSVSSLQSISISHYKGPISLPCVELTSIQKCHFKNIDGLQSLHIPSPNLQWVYLKECVGLTSVEVEAPTDIEIRYCSELKNLRIAHPIAVQSLSIYSSSSVDWGSISNLYECSCITRIKLKGVDGVFIERLLSSPSPLSSSTFKRTVALTSLESFEIRNVLGLKILNIKSPRLKHICIVGCNELTSVELESSFSDYSRMMISSCSELNNVHIANPTALQHLMITQCPKLSLSTGVDWDSLTNLGCLQLLPLPPLEELQLPQSLLQRHALGQLQISVAPASCPSFNLDQFVLNTEFANFQQLHM